MSRKYKFDDQQGVYIISTVPGGGTNESDIAVGMEVRYD
jgi:hypothetical protein